jgi:uncharacterized protein YyaL (SSP411 family)
MNNLIRETSPYLLQHAHNPVDWYAWKPEAFEKAEKEGKPILVSIGYSTCHWCHVMERESFENETVAAFMNKHFINIKVDREERPDVDQIYMEACQIISGSGGWPLNCFLTPDRRPFYAGTYYPPEPRYNRPSWIQVLQNINDAFQNKRETVEGQANRLMEIINNSDNRLLDNVIDVATGDQIFDKTYTGEIYTKLRERFDTLEGGFGGAPKFPAVMSLRFLLDYHYFSGDKEAKKHLQFSLDKMIRGGIYDHLGGGFSRYAVDRAWLVPHFEKMLYDNALLIELLSDTHKIEPRKEYADAIIFSLEYIKREMTSPEGGFYAAQDADSEGVEGKFYVWDKSEIDDLLGEEASKLFCDLYDISEAGNWEHKNILNRKTSFVVKAEELGLDINVLTERLAKSRKILFTERIKRIPPGLDDKILLDWNALMCSAYASAFSALQVSDYRDIAIRNLDFLLGRFSVDGGSAKYHTYKDGQAQYPAFLNDYAFLIKACLDVYQITFNNRYLEEARRLNDFVFECFFDPQINLYYFTAANQGDIVTRKKEIYDSATPSGNAVMVSNLLRLGTMIDSPKLTEIADQMLLKLKGAILNYPGSFAQWGLSILKRAFPGVEIAILGEEALEKAQKIQNHYLPNTVIMASQKADEQYELLKGRFDPTQTLLYLCRNYSCQRPVNHAEEILEMLQAKT